jgi:hypothetical protein
MRWRNSKCPHECAFQYENITGTVVNHDLEGNSNQPHTARLESVIFREGFGAGSILLFIRNRTDFDDETTRVMGEAFDAARAILDGQEQPELFYEIIATRILEAAKKGECDPIRLRDAGLAALR